MREFDRQLGLPIAPPPVIARKGRTRRTGKEKAPVSEAPEQMTFDFETEVKANDDEENCSS